jgi:hypothetical protein
MISLYGRKLISSTIVERFSTAVVKGTTDSTNLGGATAGIEGISSSIKGLLTGSIFVISQMKTVKIRGSKLDFFTEILIHKESH